MFFKDQQQSASRPFQKEIAYNNVVFINIKVRTAMTTTPTRVFFFGVLNKIDTIFLSWKVSGLTSGLVIVIYKHLSWPLLQSLISRC